MPIRKAIAAPLLLAKRLIINSEFSRRVLVESLGTLRGRCEVVPNGVVGPPTVRAARESLDGPVKLLYVGRLSERKGVGDAVEAIGVLRSRGIDAELGIVGSVYPGYEDVEVGLRNQVAELDLRDRVVLHGPRPEIWTALENCDVLVVPSRIDEPFGNTAVEGLLGARPVVVTRTGGLVEATGGAASALGVAPSAPEEIAGAVARIVADWQDFRERAQRDAATMAERHSPGRYRTRVVELTKSLIR